MTEHPTAVKQLIFESLFQLLHSDSLHSAATKCASPFLCNFSRAAPKIAAKRRRIIILAALTRAAERRESDSQKSVCCVFARECAGLGGRTRDKELLINDVSAHRAAKRPHT